MSRTEVTLFDFKIDINEYRWLYVLSILNALTLAIISLINIISRNSTSYALIVSFLGYTLFSISVFFVLFGPKNDQIFAIMGNLGAGSILLLLTVYFIVSAGIGFIISNMILHFFIIVELILVSDQIYKFAMSNLVK